MDFVKDRGVVKVCDRCRSKSFRVVEKRSARDERLFGWEISCTECRKRYALHARVDMSKHYEVIALADLPE